MKAGINEALRGASIAAAMLWLGATVSTPALAQVYAYPLEGQDAQQQQKDDVECGNWAINRTGFDPRRPPVYQGGYYGGSGPSSSVNSGVFGRGNYGEGGGVGDAAKGAGLGALGGAIAGNAGKGAAIGALSGLFIGGVKRSNQTSERENWERQQAQMEAQQRSQHDAHVRQMNAEYGRAFAACMSARGYRVN